MTMGDEALFAELALPVVVSPILEKVTNSCSLNNVNLSISSDMNDSSFNRLITIAHIFGLKYLYLSFLNSIS